MIELFKFKYFYFVFFAFIVIAVISNNKIKADQEIRLKADKIIVNEDSGTIEAFGEASATDEKNQILKSDHLTYVKEESKLLANGEVTIIDTFKNIYFINNLISNNGINEIKGNNVKVRLNDGSRAVGKSIIKNNNITVLNDGEYNGIIIGEVIGINIEDDFIKDGKVDVKKLKPLARLGYMDYSVIDNIFEMDRPSNK